MKLAIGLAFSAAKLEPNRDKPGRPPEPGRDSKRVARESRTKQKREPYEFQGTNPLVPCYLSDVYGGFWCGVFLL